MRADESDPTKYHEWQHVVPVGGTVLDGPVRVELATRTDRDGPDGEHVDYSAWLYGCNASGTGCVLLTSADDVHVDDWGVGPGWERRTLDIGSVHQTVAAGRVLRLRLAFDHDDVRLALDGTAPSRLVWSTTG